MSKYFSSLLLKPKISKIQNSNIPKSIHEKINWKLFKQQNHPINIIKCKIEEYFDTFKVMDSFDDPIVSVKKVF